MVTQRPGHGRSPNGAGHPPLTQAWRGEEPQTPPYKQERDPAARDATLRPM